MIVNLKQVVACAVGLIIPLVFNSSTITYTKTETLTPPTEEPYIQMAPLPIIATTTREIPEPLPLPKKLEPPPGAYCLDDCPLIEVLNDNVEPFVRSFFKDEPVMIAIAECESTFTHWDPQTGEVLKNRQGSSATGVMQLMASYHAEPAARMGIDITELEGNLEYADYLYESQGTKPWQASRTCWEQRISQTEIVGNDSPYLSYRY